MNRLFRDPGAPGRGYLALGTFGCAYLAALALVLIPDRVIGAVEGLARLLSG